MRRRWIAAFIGIVLLGCVVCPLLETTTHSNGSILNGQDSDCSVAVLAFCIALTLVTVRVVLFVSTIVLTVIKGICEIACCPCEALNGTGAVFLSLSPPSGILRI
jgi:hypothetical protein